VPERVSSDASHHYIDPQGVCHGQQGAHGITKECKTIREPSFYKRYSARSETAPPRGEEDQPWRNLFGHLKVSVTTVQRPSVMIIANQRETQVCLDPSTIQTGNSTISGLNIDPIILDLCRAGPCALVIMEDLTYQMYCIHRSIVIFNLEFQLITDSFPIENSLYSDFVNIASVSDCQICKFPLFRLVIFSFF